MEVIEGTNEDSVPQATNAAPDSPAVKVLVQTWKRIGMAQRDLLRAISIAELLEKAKSQAEQMYYI